VPQLGLQAHCQTGSCSWAGAEHGASCGSKNGLTIDGVPMGEAFASWYTASIATLQVNGPALGTAVHPLSSANHSTAAHRYYEACDLHPCGADGRARPGAC
jgi:hypothetical protein